MYGAPESHTIRSRQCGHISEVAKQVGLHLCGHLKLGPPISRKQWAPLPLQFTLLKFGTLACYLIGWIR
ncbi:hypothetical protein XELAEV_18021704mg [Xenopus laevis]|uniref:Uncharacterized protein n=1 Tax=Xenopus laevis TaxID=8355 RepID=A0A974D3A1_XENLA|nr:hypothetical protein XELAEV_18021704mg [Xenopus laevis]